MIPCHLINLKTRPDKLAKATKELAKVGIVPGVYQAVKPLDKGSFTSLGQRGCYESHMAVLKKISEEEGFAYNDVFAVAEDDIIIGDRFVRNFDLVLRLFKNANVDLLYLHNSNPVEGKLQLFDAPQQTATHFYLVTKQSAGKIYQILEAGYRKGEARTDTTDPVDCVLMDSMIIKKKTSFNLVYQDATVLSDIVTGEKLEDRLTHVGQYSFIVAGIEPEPKRSSISDTEAYRKVCWEAASDDAKFACFKSHPDYRTVLEHVNLEQGIAYLKFVIKNTPEILTHLKKFQTNDEVGKPVTCEFSLNGTTYGNFSPTTFRYVKVLSELMTLFGPLDQFSIIEIGCGYGGQAKIIKDAFDVFYDIIDLPEVEALVHRYSMKLGFDVGTFSAFQNYDLFISNYAFTELNGELQQKYLEKVISRCKRGYITCNFIGGRLGLNSLTLAELTKKIEFYGYKVELIPEEPKTAANNIILVWGRK